MVATCRYCQFRAFWNKLFRTDSFLPSAERSKGGRGHERRKLRRPRPAPTVTPTRAAGGRKRRTDGAPAIRRTRPGPIVVKKYANRRLYNTATSSYVTLDNLAAMVRGQQDFVVSDAKTGEDITRSVLTQIIFEEEARGRAPMLPISFLRQLIRLYGDTLQAYVPSYLEMTMQAFERNQETFRDQMERSFGSTPGFAQFDAMTRSNIDMFRKGDEPVRAFCSGRLRGDGGGSRQGATPLRTHRRKRLRSRLHPNRKPRPTRRK